MSLQEYQIIPMTKDTCEVVFEIAKSCLPEYWSLQNICDTLKYDNNYFYVVQLGMTQEIVGFAGMMTIADEAELLDIAILPEYRQKGLAKALLEKVESTARRKGANRMLLEVRQSNVAAKTLYSLFGYELLAVRKNYYSNPTEDADIMEHRFL